MIKEMLKMVFVDYQAHVFSVIALLWWTQIKGNKAQAVKQENCDGKFNGIGLILKDHKEDIDENKSEIKKIKTEQVEIKLSIAEKFSQKKESPKTSIN